MIPVWAWLAMSAIAGAGMSYGYRTGDMPVRTACGFLLGYCAVASWAYTR